ncbi:MAG: LamG domain-containing protein, partial [Phycisphaerales bacterium]
MCKKLTCLTVLILVLCVAGDVSADLVARWKLDEGSGTIATDSTGGYDGTLMGDTAWVEGILDGALSFDGDGDYVDCGNDPIFNPTGSFSFTLWAYIMNWETGWAHSMIGKGGDADRGGWSLRRFEDETLNFTGAGFTGDDSGEGQNHNMNGNTVPPLEEWVHIACVYDVNNMAYIYINGEVDVERPTTGGITAYDGPLY